MRKTTIFILVFFNLACEKEDLLKGNAIDSAIEIEIREDLGSKSIVLVCKSEKQYPCVNFPILTEQSFKENNKISITFTNVDESEICFTTMGPAIAKIDLKGLSNGKYELELNNGGLKNKGAISISDTEISLDFKNLKGIKIAMPLVKRVPSNSYWGTIGYARESSENAVNQFIDKLVKTGANFNKQSVGVYTHYRIDNSGQLVFDVKNSGYYYGKGLIFQYNGDELELQNLIQIDGKELKKDDIYINLNTFKGDRFFNW